jgi:3-deoxy-D-manno-octulosonate 8-phosphate phosphatase (KDO 8-P phosphatase)
MDADILRRARGVRLVTFDVDGVLTDGRIYVDDRGREFKAYHVQDGLAMKMLQHAGIAVAWITGSNAESVRHRAHLLGVHRVALGAEHKTAPWEHIRAELGVEPAACAHMGDDLPDVPLLAACGLALTVPHAPDAVKRHAHYVTRRDGGAGAVREATELILAAQSRLAEAEAAHGAHARGG